jgi:hypothetical protein
MDALFQFAQDNQGLVAVLLTSGFLPFAAKLLDAMLAIPALRAAVRGAVLSVGAIILGGCKVVQGTCRAGGIIHSGLFMRLPGGVGRSIEDSMQRFVEELVLLPLESVLPQLVSFVRWLLWTPYCKGLDADDGNGGGQDLGTLLNQTAQKAVVHAARSIPESSDPANKVADNSARHALAANYINEHVGEAAKMVSGKAVDAAIRRAVPAVKHLFGMLR